jgi:hypothetical protein
VIRVEGGAQLREVSLRLRAAGEVGLKREMYAAIRVATQPAKDAVRASALATMPKSGGANVQIAGKKIISSTLIGPRSAGVRLKMRNQSQLNSGQLRHPRFGDRSRWFTTNVPPGFWTRPLEAMRPRVTVACMVAVRNTARVAGFNDL